MSNTLGEKIQKLRKKKGLTLDKLAEMTGSSKSYIWELENKNPPRPSAEKIAKIAEKLDTNIDYLLDVDGEVSEEDASDKAFYRKYRKMDVDTKKQVQEMIKILGKGE